jgi:hypothetical protein
LDRVTEDEILVLELIRGVSDPKLQERFLQERDPTVSSLVYIAEQWQVAAGLQSVLGVDDAHAQKVVTAASTYKARQCPAR